MNIRSLETGTSLVMDLNHSHREVRTNLPSYSEAVYPGSAATVHSMYSSTTTLVIVHSVSVK